MFALFHVGAESCRKASLLLAHVHSTVKQWCNDRTQNRRHVTIGRAATSTGLDELRDLARGNACACKPLSTPRESGRAQHAAAARARLVETQNHQRIDDATRSTHAASDTSA